MSVDLTKGDVKSPSKFLKKFLMGLLNGVGGIGQEFADSALTPYVGGTSPILVKGAEWLLTALANGAISEPHLEAVISGANGASAKDLVKALINKFMPGGMSNLSLGGKAPAPQSKNDVPSAPTSEQYII